MNSWQQPVSGEPSMGTLHLIPEADRPSSWVLSNGTQTAFTDVDFGAYVPAGAKALLLKVAITWAGNGENDACAYQLRKNGSAVTDADQLTTILDQYTNLASGITRQRYSQFIVSCDSDGVIEYRTYEGSAATGGLYLNIEGYYI